MREEGEQKGRRECLTIAVVINNSKLQLAISRLFLSMSESVLNNNQSCLESNMIAHLPRKPEVRNLIARELSVVRAVLLLLSVPYLASKTVLADRKQKPRK